MKNINNWILTDDDSMQYVKKINDTTFHLIEMSLVNPEKNIFEVYEDTIDVNDYFTDMKLELEDILNSYGYYLNPNCKDKYVVEDIKSLGDKTNQIIAECIFEYYGSFQAEKLFTGKENLCKKYIKDYILTY